MRRSKKRLDEVGGKIEELPLTNAALQASVKTFCETGELPEHDRLAAQTVNWALRQPQRKPYREILLEEAMDEFPPLRDAARFVLRALISAGYDVKSRAFLDEDMEPPDCGSLALGILGFPACLVKEPHEEQAQRFLKRWTALRRRLPEDSERWFEDFVEQASAFFHRGELPNDGRMQEAVLVYAEFFALGKNLTGEADAEVLEAFDDAACNSGERREAAIRRLQELALEGRVP